MTISSRHPLFTEFTQDWKVMSDTYRGERVVKEQGATYLPPTSGMEADGMALEQPGYKAYQAYRLRSLFPDFVAEAVEVALGVMHSRPPEIDLPAALEPLRNSATINGETLENLLRRINEQQLVKGRLGLLLDLPVVPNQSQPLPYIALYKADHIINWDDNQPDAEVKPRLNMVVLDETELERRDNFDWEIVEKYRLLAMIDPDGTMTNEQGAQYGTAVFREKDSNYSPQAMIFPTIRGQNLERLPFVIINTKDLVSTPDDPPLLGLARLALAVYRGEADYRQNLFMQGQDTLVIIGDMQDDGGEAKRVGAGALVRLPAGGDAKYVGVNSTGLAEQREALQNDRNQALLKTGALINSGSAERESGDALRIRVAAQTASLNQIALTGAAGLEQLLQTAAEWVGADPKQVAVRPNLEFAANDLTGKSLVELISAKAMGAKLSHRSIHALMRDRGITKLEFDEETAEIDTEEPMELPGTGAGGDPEDEEDKTDE